MANKKLCFKWKALALPTWQIVAGFLRSLSRLGSRLRLHSFNFFHSLVDFILSTLPQTWLVIFWLSQLPSSSRGYSICFYFIRRFGSRFLNLLHFKTVLGGPVWNPHNRLGWWLSLFGQNGFPSAVRSRGTVLPSMRPECSCWPAEFFVS